MTVGIGQNALEGAVWRKEVAFECEISIETKIRIRGAELHETLNESLLRRGRKGNTPIGCDNRMKIFAVMLHCYALDDFPRKLFPFYFAVTT